MTWSGKTRAATFVALGLAVGAAVWLAVEPYLDSTASEPEPDSPAARAPSQGPHLRTRRPRAPSPARTPALPLSPGQVEGERLFDEAALWVAREGAPLGDVRDSYYSLDAVFDLDNQHHEGLMRLWFESPDKWRQELTNSRGTTTKILNGDQLWIVEPTGSVRDENQSGEAGARWIAQSKDDRERLRDLTTFVTLAGLKGPGITFEFLGPKTGKGEYAGEWLKIKRTAPEQDDISFWLAYTRDAAGRAHATWPGVVRVVGDPATGLPAEDYILKEWQDSPADPPRAYRYPHRIQAWQTTGPQTAVRFLNATVDDLKINAGIDDARFQPPPTR